MNEILQLAAMRVLSDAMEDLVVLASRRIDAQLASSRKLLEWMMCIHAVYIRAFVRDRELEE